MCAIGGERLTHAEKHSRKWLLEAVEEPLQLQEVVLQAYKDKRQWVDEDQMNCVKCCKTHSNLEQEEVQEEFLEDVRDDVRDEALSSFSVQTGNEALHQVVCVVCAGEFFNTEAMEHFHITDFYTRQELFVDVDVWQNNYQTM